MSAGIDDDFAGKAVGLGGDAGENDGVHHGGLGGVEAHGHEGLGELGGRRLVTKRVGDGLASGIIVPGDQCQFGIKRGAGGFGCEVAEHSFEKAGVLDQTELLLDERAQFGARFGIGAASEQSIVLVAGLRQLVAQAFGFALLIGGPALGDGQERLHAMLHQGDGADEAGDKWLAARLDRVQLALVLETGGVLHQRASCGAVAREQAGEGRVAAG